MERTNQFFNGMDAINCSSSKNFVTLDPTECLFVDRNLLSRYGPKTAIFQAILMETYTHFKSNKTLKDERWFYITHREIIARQFGFTETTIRTCKSKLKKDGFLTTKMIGMPAKEWYCIHWDVMIKILEELNYGTD